MHSNKLPQHVIEDAIEKRGSLHPLADFNSTKSALIVIDMQKFFLGMMPAARSIVPNINRLAKAIRLGGGQVVWVSMTVTENDVNQWSHFFGRLLSQRWRDAHIEKLARDSDDWQLADDLHVADSDWHVEKSRFSAFIQGSSDLESRLREADIRTLLIAGTATNVGCETTARDAMMLDFPSIMVADGCAALDDASHMATLANFQTIFGDVLTVDEILAGIDKTVQLNLSALPTG